MRKIFLLTFVFAFTASAFAQPTFGVQVGANLANVRLQKVVGNTTIKPSSDSRLGFLAGIFGEFSITRSFAFRPEINYIQKGYETKDSEDQGGGVVYKIENTITLNYVELPLILEYKVQTSLGTVFFGAGPVIGYGMSGEDNYKKTGSGVNLEKTTEVKFDGKADAIDNFRHLKAMDMGINILAGYKITNGISINLGYSHGLSNLEPNSKYGALRTNGVFLKIGYNFMGYSASSDD